MLPTVSGLGRLFGAASSLAPHNQRAQRQLESVTEEAHTYDLLYPEAGSLRPGQHHTFQFRHGDPSSIAAAANSSDDKGGLPIQFPRDLRIVIGQYIGGNSRLIYDSQPSLQLSGPTTPQNLNKGLHEAGDGGKGHQRNVTVLKSHTAPHSRQSSFSQVAQSMFMSPSSPLSPVSEASALFGGSRRPNTSEGENAQAMLVNEEAKETEAMLLSIFGAPGFRADTGTKIHVKPYTPNEHEALRPPSSGATRISSQSRRTPLTRSTTSEDLQSMTAIPGASTVMQQAARRKSSSILITRVFHIDPMEDKVKAAVDTPVAEINRAEKTHSRTSSSDEKTNQIRTPAFAIALVLYIPTQQQISKRPISSRASPVLGYSTLHQDPVTAAQQFNKEILDQSVDYIMAHWRMIARALSSLEVTVRCQICNQLAQLDICPPATPLMSALPEQKPGAKAIRMRAPPRPTLQLPVGALQNDALVQRAIETTGRRIIASLQIRMVAVGQDRWGIWREEARGVGKWAGGQEQGFFFFALVSAFLAHHDDWLDNIGWKLLKAKHRRRSEARRPQQIEPVKHRTIIVSQDKMAARRLIFLLSAFLPGAFSEVHRNESYKSDMVASGPTATTPPSCGTSMSRRYPPRRSVRRSRCDVDWHEAKNGESAIIDYDTATEVSDDRTIVEAPSIYQHSRQSSDARSIRSLALPIATERSQLRNSSVATTATIHPELSVPVPHFSAFHPDTHPKIPVEWRPGSSGSIASLSLQRTLSRSESNDQSGTSMDSFSSGRWFWGSRRGSSTETSETPISSGEALGIYGMPKESRDPRSVNKLTQMVEDAALLQGNHKNFGVHEHGQPLTSNFEQKYEAPDSPSVHQGVSLPFELEEPFPLDLSVNEEDGVIDIKLPPSNTKASSFGSIISSPRATRPAPRGLKEQSNFDMQNPEMLPPVQRPEHWSKADVGGWLRRFHSDLDLQAVQPYDTLKGEIKQAMRTEPIVPLTQSRSSSESDDEEEGWRTVSTSLVADTASFRITLISLRRRHASSAHHQADALLGLHTKDNPDEEFREETLTASSMDPTLVEAIERVLSHSGHSSRTASRAPSRPSSPYRSSPRSGVGDYHTSANLGGLAVPKTECKRVVLGALEHMARSVAKEMTVAPGENEASLRDSRRKSHVSSSGSTSKTKMEEDWHTETVPDSILKGGIRRWFAENSTYGSATAQSD